VVSNINVGVISIPVVYNYYFHMRDIMGMTGILTQVLFFCRGLWHQNTTPVRFRCRSLFIGVPPHDE